MQDIRSAKKVAAARVKQAKLDYDNATSQQAAERAEQEMKQAIETLMVTEQLEEPSHPAEIEEQMEDDIPEIFFTGPKQMLDKYKEMEGKNLFLIQNIQAWAYWFLPSLIKLMSHVPNSCAWLQEMEELLEDLSVKAATSKMGMQERITALQLQENELDLELAAEHVMAEELQR